MVHRTQTKNPRKAVAVPPREKALLVLVAAMEEPLDRAIAYGAALALMGYGLNRIGDDHGDAILATAETLLRDLETAKSLWQKALALKLR